MVKNCKQVKGKVFKNNVDKGTKKGLKQVADIQHNTLVQHYFTFMGNSTTITIILKQTKQVEHLASNFGSSLTLSNCAAIKSNTRDARSGGIS